MTQSATPFLTYRPGTWFGVFGERVTVVLPPSEKRRVAALWELVDDGAGFDVTLDALIATGLRDFPGFVLVAPSDEHTSGDVTKVVLRGAATAHFETEDGDVVVDGTAASTWVERSITGVRGMRIEVDIEGSDDYAGADLTVVRGLVRLSRIATPATDEAPSSAEPRSPVEPASDTSSVVEPVSDVASVVEPVSAVSGVATPATPEPARPEVPAFSRPRFPLPAGPTGDVPSVVEPASAASGVETIFDDSEASTETATDKPPQPPSWAPGVPSRPDGGSSPVPDPAAPSSGFPPPPPYVAPGAHAAPMPAAPAAAKDLAPAVEAAAAQSDPAGAGPARPDDHDGLTRDGSWNPAEFARQQPGIPGQPPAPSVTAVPVAKLVFSSGETVPVDRAIIVGRAPEARRFTSAEQPRLVTVPSPHQEISSTHLEVRPGAGVDHGSAVVTDLGSTNGTVLVQPGLNPEDLQPGIAVQLIPGAILDLGDGVTIQITQP